MTVTIVILTLAWLSYLMWEAQNLHKARSKLFHVIHVNGTRGKSTVSRLIDAGLRAGTFCKTTGTDPMTIDVSGSEELIYRRGRANIKEQIRILKRAAAQEAQVLVVECMAVQPELQHTAQHDILKADIGVITNVRRDHTDVMGNSMAQICDSLSNTIPQRGILFTAEAQYLSRLTKNAQVCACQVVPVTPDGTEPDFDFPDNIALALKVCEHLGVERETALAGMAHYKRDPYALSVYQLGNTLFINGLSINDVQPHPGYVEGLSGTASDPGMADRGSTGIHATGFGTKGPGHTGAGIVWPRGAGHRKFDSQSGHLCHRKYCLRRSGTDRLGKKGGNNLCIMKLF